MIWMVGKMGGFGLFGVGFKGRLITDNPKKTLARARVLEELVCHHLFIYLRRG
ncbi:hypothetical protein [uncultured Gammaproteobacteria bacterium]|nr:hypothetical protein [uncultured Gammaproteobacteria bacterium]